MTEQLDTEAANSTEETTPDTPTSTASSPRLWPAVLLVVLMWGAMIGSKIFFKGTMVEFMGGMMSPMVCGVLLALWWLFASRVSWKERGIGLVLILGLFTVAKLFSDKTVADGLQFFYLPWVLTVIVGSMLLVFIGWPKRRWISVFATAAYVVWVMTLRLNGLSGSFQADTDWRWEPTREEVFLTTVSHDASAAPAEALQLPEELSATDWPEFRGPLRDSRVTGVRFSTNWEEKPPREVWRREVGPGWGSFTVIGDTIFTQEQRGEQEAVTAYNAKTGEPIWVNEVKSRFTETIGGPGPRATPTYHEGKLYSQGAAGKLLCIDAATGKTIWERDLMEDTPAKTPIWGFSASPLVVGDLVLTYSGAGEGKSVVAYNREYGEIAWTAGNGNHSYSSPHLATLDGVPQVLMVSNAGLLSLAPEDGKELWFHDWEMPTGANRVVQPLLLGNDVLLGTFLGMGTQRISVSQEENAWSTEAKWTSKQMKPYFNDFVQHDGYLYGFDNEIFACINLEDGKREWKRGRYGHGQVLLVEDMGMLLVLGEEGQLVLLEANPDKLVEIAEIQAVEGKTWNHPVISGNLLFVRNGNEAVCYELN